MEMINNVVICINLIDEVEKKGIVIDEKKLVKLFGVFVVKILVCNWVGIGYLLNVIVKVVNKKLILILIKIIYSEKIENMI